MMKDKFLLFVIGVLVGAVISTGAFFVYTKTNTTCSNSNNQMQMPGGEPPSMQNTQGEQNGEPPAKPEENNSQDNNQTDGN